MKNNRIQTRSKGFRRELQKCLNTGRGKYSFLSCQDTHKLLSFIDRFDTALLGLLDWETVWFEFMELDNEEVSLTNFVPVTLIQYLYPKVEHPE